MSEQFLTKSTPFQVPELGSSGNGRPPSKLDSAASTLRVLVSEGVWDTGNLVLGGFPTRVTEREWGSNCPASSGSSG